jgi:hypothetical protein
MSEMKESGLKGANFVVKNWEGEVCLALKQKINEVTGGTYYVFEMHLDRVPTEALVKFQEVWDAARFFAVLHGIHLYDIAEITEKIMEKVGKEGEKAKNFEITVRDHASGMIHRLIVGAGMVEKKMKQNE